MNNRIHTLPKDIAEKIASGEVVERPLSVVKELVENALDAGADSVTVEITRGGTDYIRVTDNGSGIPKDDVALAFERFSTSKIASVIRSLYLLPRFVPVLVAVYALKMILSDSGLINRLSMLLPEGSPLYNFKPGLLYNAKGIIIANLWFNIPFATMIISAALSGISSSIVESAQDVGAGKIRIFFKMILPLSISDVMIAATFVFMSNVSSFTTPYLIGANHPMMLGVYLRKQFSSRKYELAAAVSCLIFLFSSISAIVYIYTNLKEKAWERD